MDEESLRIGDYIFFARDIRRVELLRKEACLPVRDWPEAKEEIALWFSERWGAPPEFCRKSVIDCLCNENGAPQWYVVVRGSRIVAGCGVIENDFHERKDLAPNVCAVFVEEDCRGRGIAGFMLRHVCGDMAAMGFDTLYLMTDLDGFFERYGWQFLCTARRDGGELSRIYVHRQEPEQETENIIPERMV